MMIAFLGAEHNELFLIALMLLVGLFLVEVVLLFIGLSSDLGIDTAEVGEVGLEPVPDLGSAEMDLIDPASLGEPELATAAPGGFTGVLVWMGLSGVPSLIWLGALCLGFSLSGFGVQVLASSLWAPLPQGLAFIPALAGGILSARVLSSWLGRLIPSVETYVTSGFNRRRGVVVIGVSKRGFPAQISYMDSYGTERLIMAEPLLDTDEIHGGTEVLLVRDRQMNPRIIALA